jgi:hypothetical protein
MLQRMRKKEKCERKRKRGKKKKRKNKRVKKIRHTKGWGNKDKQDGWSEYLSIAGRKKK